MSVEAALRKLEKEAGVGRRCLNCRVHYIKFGDEIRRTPEADLYVNACGRCGHVLKFIHSGYTPRERAVLIYAGTAPEEEQNGARWIASYVWTHHLPRFLEMEKIGVAEEKRLRTLTGDPAARRQVKVLDELAAHEARVRAVMPDSDTLPADWRGVLDALDAVRDSRPSEPRLKDDNVFCYAVLAEMEVFMWGAKSEETLQLIEDRHAELVEKARATAERLEREREERERERVERDEKFRHEREQRERERAERDRLQSVRPRQESLGDPASRFRINPAAPVPNHPIIVDPEAVRVPDPADPSRSMVVGRSIGPDTYDPNHPDAVQLQRSTPPDPTAGLTIEGIEAERERSRKSRLYYRPDDYEGDRRY